VPGKIESPAIFCGILLLALAGAGADLVWGRIFNWLTVSGALLGLLVSAWVEGWLGPAYGVLAILTALVLFGWIFWAGALGGGDVKLLMALGAWGGVRFTVDVALLSLVLSGIFGVIQIFWKGDPRGFARRIYVSACTAVVKEMEFTLPQIDKTLTMPFGVPIAIAAIWVATWNPWSHWGLSLWSR
jgi:prepilin peptidase CpaA